MLRIGIIGLGHIATTAYLPLLGTRAGLQLHLCSRNTQTMQQLAARYQVAQIHSQLESLIEAGIQAAFVHAASVAHYTLIKPLLEANIAVFVDKPLTLHLSQSKELVQLAQQTNTLLMVGFNRRYAPIYRELKAVEQPTMIVMQKNRTNLPGPIRSFVLDDFIHVVDTLRWLFPYPIADTNITFMGEGDRLSQLTLQLRAQNGQMAMGIMNRNTVVTEERLEIMSPAQKLVAVNIAQLIKENQSSSHYTRQNDWETTLQKRGFVSMIEDFLQAVVSNSTPYISLDDALLTHQLCEDIVGMVSEQGGLVSH